MDKILTVEDVAEILKVQPITVREMFRENRLRAFKMGKAWRTTETMLEEDLAALAQGRKPDPLPAQAAPARRPRAAAPKADRLPAAALAQTAPAAETPAPEPAPKPARAPRAPKPAPVVVPEAEPEESQQLLF